MILSVTPPMSSRRTAVSPLFVHKQQQQQQQLLPHVLIIRTLSRQNTYLLCFIIFVASIIVFEYAAFNKYAHIVLDQQQIYNVELENVYDDNQSTHDRYNYTVYSNKTGNSSAIDDIDVDHDDELQILVEESIRDILSGLPVVASDNDNLEQIMADLNKRLRTTIQTKLKSIGTTNKKEEKNVEDDSYVSNTEPSGVEFKTRIFSDDNSIKEELQSESKQHATNNIISPVHIMYGLSGNEKGFIHEFEVSLKSLLLNAPYHSNLTIHVLADDDAYNSLDNIFYNITNLTSWRSNQVITIITYNVEPYLNEWSMFIEEKTVHPIYNQTWDHTIGTYFRLLAHTILPLNEIKYVLYMDTDIVLMANADNIWQYTTYQHQQHVWKSDILLSDDGNSTHTTTNMTYKTFNSTNNNDPFFIWGEDECAGFVLINLHELQTLWELISQMDLDALSWEVWDWINDQFILRMISKHYPQRVAILPIEWDVSIAGKSNLWQGNLQHRRPTGVGMLHFNGGGASKTSAYYKSDFVRDSKFQYTWGNANYYVNLPWIWAKFIVESHINPYRQTTSHSTTATDDRTRGEQRIETNNYGYPIVIHHNEK
jgi:hypothetical protein